MPLHPRTAEDRERLESIRLFVLARSLEDQANFRESIKLLKQALEKDPNSTTVLDRLSQLSFAMGRLEEGVDYSRKALVLDPNATANLMRLVVFYLREKHDPPAAAALIEETLKNPKIDPKSAGYILGNRLLGDLDMEFLDKVDAAADAYEKVVKALDDPASLRLSRHDQELILRRDEADSYIKFGEVFLKAKRFDLANLAFRRGLDYDPENGQLPRFLAESLLRSGQSEKALQTLESYLKHQPQGREAYELLGEILKALGREKDLLTQLEDYARADPNNVSLQFALVDRYRELGRNEDADKRLEEIRKKQGDPQVYGPLSASLLKERKTPALVEVLRDAVKRDDGLEKVKPQIDAIVNDPEYAGKVLEEAIKQLKAKPETFTTNARRVFAFIASQSKQIDKLVELDRENLKLDPNPQSYQELLGDLINNKRYSETADVLKEMFEAYPAERTPDRLRFLAQCYYFDNKLDDALKAAQESVKQDPNNIDTQLLIGFLLGKLSKNQDAVTHYQQILANFPNNEEIERRARSGLSAIYVNMDDLENGEKELEILLAKDPDDPGVNNDLGYLYADQGKNLEKAEAMIRKALEEDPENTAYLDSLGWVLFKRGKYEEALGPMETASKETGVDATIFDHLGDLYYQLKKFDNARSAWKKAEEIATKTEPPDKRLDSIRKKLKELERLTSSLDGGKNPQPGP